MQQVCSSITLIAKQCCPSRHADHPWIPLIAKLWCHSSSAHATQSLYILMPCCAVLCHAAVMCRACADAGLYCAVPSSHAAIRVLLCCAVASTVGATLVYPGANQLNTGGTNPTPPYLTGLGAVFTAWVLAPLLTMSNAVPFYLWNRKKIFRTDDPFHRALWVCCWNTVALF